MCYEEQLVLNGQLRSNWLELMEQFPDRFMIGSDVMGSMTSYVSTMTRYYVILDALKSESATKVARTNFLDILPKAKVGLPKSALRGS